ncbi:MAG TPA: transcription elongation factor GreA [Candidatus Pristimantibacillus sp.]|jgi:transcription elongation factor GreA|nr:transcription elongation factor GreA [Candidatus Pristimantibacillus sp.]
MNKLFHLTKQGVTELQGELDELIAQRAIIADRIKTAREFGDLGENMEYTAARQDQERNENRISEIEHILKNVQVISAPKSDGKVVLGSTVSLKSEDGKTKQFQVVGTVEADPLNGKISDESPIGRALIGKKNGEEVEIKTPVETALYRIANIA